ncbi:WAT1-related protein At2g39510-like [Olea europaea var. sylvestris]|uniref:WAT1-related protein At2g39510-like n=1 Tax=Olea europaea var. sylvestris TaxID=158386 RepID=UPI000C1D49CB|nr:WAT1-related protein At2g39510-like [Olea europaea var. sylvestris]
MDFLSIFLKKAKPYMAAIFLRFVFAGLFTIAKHALNLGMSHYIFTVYRNVIAAVVFGPFGLAFERNTRPRMTLPILFKIFLLGLLGVLDQNLYYAGMKHTTATFATTIYNFLPVINFLLSLLLRLEKVKFRSLHGLAKVIGTFVCVGGVLAMTFVKGPLIGLPWTKHKPTSAANYHQNSFRGPLMIFGACFFAASFNVIQAKTLESYIASLSLTAMISAVMGIEGFIASVVFEKGINFAVWSIHWDIKLLACVYGEILCSGLGYYISGYILQEKGPVFLTSFNPLTMLIVAGMSSFILAEQLELGKVVGGFVIVVRLYLVLWGKTKDDHSIVSKVSALNSSSMKASSSDGSQATTADIF